MPSNRRVFALIFFVSGFSGLIYEALWTHYLKLFLGHAAYAQTLVLAIFMGGLALGSEVCSRSSHRLGNLLRWYAIAEAIVGVMALAFAPVFSAFLELSYGSVFPSLGSPTQADAYKYVASALFILPQSFLLGTTFPLMTAGLVRRFPERRGATIATLYFVNSLGAAIGVLASGFVFIDWFGLQGTLTMAGIINLLLAAIVWRISGDQPLFAAADQASSSAAGEARLERTESPTDAVFGPRLLLTVALITGAASFVYEVCWIRMLSMVLGNSTHSFELMLSAFITGLAFGGLWVRSRIDRQSDPIRLLATIQVVMGMCAMLTLPMYMGTFDAMQWLMASLEPTDTGYTLFNLSSHALALAVMLPTTFCAGTTLPLITFCLLRRGHGEKCIGQVYAWNTIGAILGVMLTVHFGFPLLGVKESLIVGAIFDVGIGLVLVWLLYRSGTVPVAWTSAVALLLVGSTLFPLDTLAMASGVYRQGKLLDTKATKLQFHEDGKTATISLTRRGNTLSIRTNGKVDASLAMRKQMTPTEDELTMILAGAIPLAIRPDAKTAANIGMGSGLTTHTLLCSPNLEVVDTIEIEPVMTKAAEQFGERVELAYTDPRSAFHFDDAKAFFASARREYDIIVSEPSNPWVSGVASLFSEDFYARVKRYLAEDGVFVQWIQLYEIDTRLVASVLGALSNHFSDFVAYAPNRGDMLLISVVEGKVPELGAELFRFPRMAEELKRQRKQTIEDIRLHWVTDKQTLEPWIRSVGIRPNSNDRPVVDLGAARTRFLRADALEIYGADMHVVPVYAMLSRGAPPRPPSTVPPTYLERSVQINQAAMTLAYLGGGAWSWPKNRPGGGAARREADQLRRILRSESVSDDRWYRAVRGCLARSIVPHLAPEALDPVWRPLANTASESQRQFVEFLQAVSIRDARRMADLGEAILATTKESRQGLVEYVLSVAMLGKIVTLDKEGAAELWEKYGSATSERMRKSFRTHVLRAHCR